MGGNIHPAARPSIALKVQDLSVSFSRGAINPVSGISFEVRQGETVGIVGESGSGKSLTGLAIMRLLAAGAQVGGSVEMADASGASIDLLQLSEQRMRKVRGAEIAMIFQEPMTSLNPIRTVGYQLSEAIRLHQDQSARAARATAIDLLTEVGIADPHMRIHAYPHQLSGGMRQRVMIAMALACKPRLIIADEPTTALDVTVQAQVIDLLTKLQSARGMAMIFVTHDLPLIRNVADSVAVMYSGQIVEQGDTASVFERPRHPYTQALLNSSPVLGQRRATRRLQAIAGGIPSPAQQPQGCCFHPRCAYARPGLCDVERPALEPVETAHAVRCHLWRQIEAKRAS